MIACVVDGPKDIDVLRWMSRAALELVGQAGLGYSFDPLTHEVPNQYAEALKSFSYALLLQTIGRRLVNFLLTAL